jgi:purine nucleosidase
MAAEPRPILIDCDPGIDDAVALLLAFSMPEALEVTGITAVAGNVPLAATERNARSIRGFAGRPEVPVFAGCPRPMMAAPRAAGDVHGMDGLGGVRLPGEAGGLAARHGVDAIVEQVADRPGLAVAAVGPLTNLAVAIVKRPDILNRIGTLVIMGGGIAKGNITSAAEFNIFVDPEAARTVFEAGLRPIVVPLDATHRAPVTAVMIDELRRCGEGVAPEVGRMLEAYHGNVGRDRPGAHVHDAMALAVLIWPELFEIRPARLSVVTDSGPERGRTIADFDSAEPNAEVVIDLDASLFLERLFGRLRGFARQAP